jgi:hypothetical protein
MGRKAYTKTQKVQKFLERNAGASAPEIAKATGVGIQYVYNIVSSSRKYKVGDVAHKITKGRGRPRKEKEVTDEVKKIADGIIHGVSGKRYQVMDFSMDMVNSPSHYKVGGIETIDFIEAKQLGYHLGNAVKYISRADHKGARIQDLEKAKWYLDREIKRLSA